MTEGLLHPGDVIHIFLAASIANWHEHKGLASVRFLPRFTFERVPPVGIFPFHYQSENKIEPHKTDANLIFYRAFLKETFKNILLNFHFMNIYVETYGCTANVNNGELAKGILAKNNTIVDSEKDADVIVLNTCVVKGPTENRIIARIKELNHKRLIITGCMPDANPDMIKKVCPDALLVSSHRIKDISEALEKNIDLLDRQQKVHEIKLGLPKINANPYIEIIQISEGCLGICTFCMTKAAKGNVFSYPISAIIHEIENSSAKEFWLTSQDCGAYGLDNGTNLVSLLTEISKIPKEFKVRVGMANPNHIKRMLFPLIEIFKNDKILKFLHCPIKAGSDEVLKKMKRGYSKKDYVEIISAFKKNIPEMTFSTDVICGFPTETEEEFNETLEVIKETKPDIVNISRYWIRPNTLAAELPQLDVHTVMNRSKRMSELCKDISHAQNKEWIGWIGKVFISEINENNFSTNVNHKKSFIGRNYAYKTIAINSSEILLGKEIFVKITSAGPYSLIGEIIVEEKNIQEKKIVQTKPLIKEKIITIQ